MRAKDGQLMLYNHDQWHVISYDTDNRKIVLWNDTDGVSVRTLENENHSHSHSNHNSNDSRCPLCNQPIPSSRPNSWSGSDLNRDAFQSRDYFLLLDHQRQQQRNSDGRRRENGAADPLSPESLNSGYYSRFFQQEKKIGSGGFGAVFLARHVIHGIDLGLYAVKKVPVGDNIPWLHKVIAEVKALETIQKHPNIVNYQHSWLEYGRCADFGPEIPCLFILMEYANGGSLADVIWNPRQRGGLPEDLIWKYFIDICEGLNYLHQCGIVHRDLKPQNILLHQTIKNGIASTHLLISDFGTCQRDQEKPYKRTGATGTVEYVAPELLRTNEAGDYVEFCDEKSDVWSLGVVLYAMAFKELPFLQANLENCDREELAEEILRFRKLKFPGNHNRSEAILNMTEALMSILPRDRPTTVEILTCPFISNLTSTRNEMMNQSSTANGSPYITRIPNSSGKLNKVFRRANVPRQLSSSKFEPLVKKVETHHHPPSSPTHRHRLLSDSGDHIRIPWLLLPMQLLVFIPQVVFWMGGLQCNPRPLHIYVSLLMGIAAMVLDSVRPRVVMWAQFSLAGIRFVWTLLYIVQVGLYREGEDSGRWQLMLHMAFTTVSVALMMNTSRRHMKTK
ncbi:hypothetical protein PROFUN_07682 [Planoprotostelium fungivorum]|uniref:non-specific serine/threonine protein kinase n=1 Tax=Planoprotostelium fungivorum TaxID=1890364 RepID=A0A2P6MM62_9EUKA|nr:hypothetical protein PROFUN_07682 [Planoprotostelium fungivorum]